MMEFSRHGFHQSSRSIVTRWSKHGQISVLVGDHDPHTDMTVFMDISHSPGR